MTTQLQTAIESYISKDDKLSKEIEKMQLSFECEFDDVDILESRVDIMAKNLKREVNISALSLGMTPFEFIAEANEYENRNLN